MNIYLFQPIIQCRTFNMIYLIYQSIDTSYLLPEKLDNPLLVNNNNYKCI
jgi:hypothetical protein